MAKKCPMPDLGLAVWTTVLCIMGCRLPDHAFVMALVVLASPLATLARPNTIPPRSGVGMIIEQEAPVIYDITLRNEGEI
jgi:hypothetical protein